MSERFRTWEQASAWLESIPSFATAGARAANFGLERIETICSRLGSPHLAVPLIHVAGTNGKGTTCRMLASVFQEAGYRTGLYTSPHLLEFNERVRVDAVPIRNEEILDFLRQAESALEEIPLTYFEISTAIAFWYFRRRECDLAVVETGLGGRLDATNIADPLACAITSVSMDHTDLLGGTIAAIAAEKAGIVKPGRPVVIGPLEPEAEKAVRKRAAETGSPVVSCLDYQPEREPGRILLRRPADSRPILLSGAGFKPVDRFNAAVTLALVDLAADRFPNVLSRFSAGMERMQQRFPDHGVFQRMHPQRDWYFDGAHNPEAVRSLLEQIGDRFPERIPVFVLSMMKEKATGELLETFRAFPTIHYIDSGTERSAPCEQIRRSLPQLHCLDGDDVETGRLLDSLKTELVIFTGSFYFYRQVTHWIASQSPSDQTNRSGSDSRLPPAVK